jgi:hypothetical protein
MKKILLMMSSLFVVVLGYAQEGNISPPNHNNNSGQMTLSPAAANTSAGTQIASDSPADAILAQTSYLARVLIQANDIYPPSHVSTRENGEIFASTKIPLDYNLKLLSETSVYRNFLGAVNTSGQGAANSGSVNSKDKVMRDWVEYHINKYCDPLAASMGSNGLNNCHGPLKSLSSAEIAAAKAQGQTAWEYVATKTNGGFGPFAADIDAKTLFSSKINYPEAAMRYVYNVTNALPRPIRAKQADPQNPVVNYTIPNELVYLYNGQPVLKEDGYEKYLKHMEAQAQQSLSQYALMKILSERMPMSNIRIPVTKWGNDGKKTIEMQPTSRYGLMEFEANKRFQDPAWYDRVQQMPTPALLKELAYMMAMQLSLEFKRYEQQQIQTALLARSAGGSDGAVEALDDMMAESQEKAQIMAQDAASVQNQMQNIMNQQSQNASSGICQIMGTC